MNEQREYALEALKTLLEMDRIHAQKRPDSKGRLLDGKLFIASREKDPPWDKTPENWGSDWCEGWAYALPEAFASSLGINLLPRIKTEMVNGKKVVRNFLVWTQSTRFCFEKGTVHAFAHNGRAWGEHLKENETSIVITGGKAASPQTGGSSRDAGAVAFKKLIRTEDGGSMREAGSFSTSQDEFVRFLITGELPEKPDE